MSASFKSSRSCARPASLLSSTKLVSLPRPVSMVSQGMAGSSGPEISSTSAPCAASVRPATGPAMTREGSSTRRPASGRALFDNALGRGLGGPRRRRRFVVDAQITLGAAFDDGMAHADANVLHLTAAQLPYLGGSETGGGDRRLPGNGDAKGGWDLRLLARQPHAFERGRIAADGGPDIAENAGGALHLRFSPLALRPSISTQR